ncbi:MAG: response regulator [Planctomycetota bacterium]|nr:response regulator [Planctomycetota bacterium]
MLPSPTLRAGHETILVAEDEEPVRQFVVSALRRYGYHVLEASDGQEALKISGEYGERIDLLLTDVVMPTMSGPELADRLAAARPETKILYMSGYTSDSISTQGLLKPGVNHVAKPFGPDVLAEKVRLLLEA